MTNRANSPASSGPAGAHFEGQVGAYYLLSMLASAEPRGLPGTAITSVELQRAAETFSLDDVIIHARNTRGEAAVLEIQVKRSVSFTRTDTVFRSVVSQIVEASRKPEFKSTRYELAIAIAKTSHKIDGAYQEVLTLARQLGDAPTFFARVGRPGSVNEAMRTFVSTFRSNVASFGGSDDEETVWMLLRRLQILVFDFTAAGSAVEELVKERALQVLHADDGGRASNLWASLVELSIDAAASGGDRDREGLINELTEQSYRFKGERRFESPRNQIFEASELALSDINDRIGDVSLTRNGIVAAINDALDSGRYVEIRGDPGVGKSAVLKHFARQIGRETKPFVLSPNRIIPRGWIAMGSQIGFNGTPKELLSDYAVGGGAIIFIDSLDFFSEQERVTVRDLIREAPDVPGIQVVVTARRDFGETEPNWLPSETLSRLGIAGPVVVDELTNDEIEELKCTSPSLAPLLEDSHPARDVARNLFRLARLASLGSDLPLPHTEVAMAQQWWNSADGNKDESHRARARLLRDLAKQSIRQTEPLNANKHPPNAVDGLITSGTLIDLGSDNVSFKHDVFREWAIACLIDADISTIQELPLKRTASPELARAVELASRAMLEKESEPVQWASFLTELSSDKLHGSWRRAVILALVRSEMSIRILDRTSSLLFTDNCKLLCELIQLVMAVDVQPAAKALADAGFDTSLVSDKLNMPSGPSWGRLIIWLHRIEQELPGVVAPLLIDLYTNWLVFTSADDQLTRSLLNSFFNWLTQIEDAREAKIPRDASVLFGNGLEYQQFRSLEKELRTGFLLFCNHTPELATKYLQNLKNRQRNRDTVIAILQFRGSLAAAAPAELAELTASALIPDNADDEKMYRGELREPFSYVGHLFIPASPAQGPFFELLIHAPEIGIALIRQLVEHAVGFYSEGREYDDNAISIMFPDGERKFPWARSYNWPRGGTGNSCVTCGLMALEGWAHRRIEAGHPFAEVVEDVLGPPGSPAAFVLVAVDLILSHWPVSREVAIHYVASPELLSIDKTRAAHDSFEYPDIFGLKGLHQEPPGVIDIESLNKRPSRRYMLDQVLGHYALFEPFTHRERVRELMQNAVLRLGPPEKYSDLSDPRFMAIHALNRINPDNYRLIADQLNGRSEVEEFEYVPPNEENRHFDTLREVGGTDLHNSNMQLHLSRCVDSVEGISSQFLEAAVDWAMKVTEETENSDTHDAFMRDQAVAIAAMIAMRDGDDNLRENSAEWAHEVFDRALEREKEPAHLFHEGIQFNPVAISFVGVVYGVKNDAPGFEFGHILRAVSRGNPGVAHGFGVTAEILQELSERSHHSILRLAFLSCVRGKRSSKQSEEDIEKIVRDSRERIFKAIEAELAWLRDDGTEPNWPKLPPHEIYQNDGFASRNETPAQSVEYTEDYFDHQAGALWLRNLRNFITAGRTSWFHPVSHNYGAWTMAANGAGFESHVDITNQPSDWNNVYFDLLALSLSGIDIDELHEQVLKPICSLPDDPFFDVASIFMRSVDEALFNELGLEEVCAIHIRSTVANRLIDTNSWARMRNSLETTIDMHMGPLVATVLFNEYSILQPPRCYLYAKAIRRIGPFLDTAKKLSLDAPSLPVAVFVFNFLEVSPRPNQLPFLMSVVNSWFNAFRDAREFWVDQGVGSRFCKLIRAILNQDESSLDYSNPSRVDLDRILAGLVSLGVPDAKRLEEELVSLTS